MVKRRKKLKTRLTAVLLTFGMVASSVATNLPSRIFGVPDEAREVYASGDTYTDANGVIFTYEDLADGGVQITRINVENYNNVSNGTLDLVIPETITVDEVDKPVTTLTSNAIANADKFKSVTFGSNVKAVPASWGSFTNVTSIGFANNSKCTEIGNEAFKGSGNLKTVTFPSSLKTIGNSVFVNCGNLNSVNLGDTAVETIGSCAFQGTKIDEITFPDSLKTIGKQAFNNCVSLASVTFGVNSNLTAIEDEAFKGCTALTSIAFPDSLTTLGIDSFMNCGVLTSVTWPDNPEFTTVRGFYGSSALGNNVLRSIPSSVTTIDDNAFYGVHFSEIYISPFITTIGENAFSSNAFLTGNIVITEGSNELTIKKNAFYLVYDQNTPQYTDSEPKEIVLPKRVVEIQDGSFNLYNKNWHKFTIKNDSINIVGDPWKYLGYTYFSYPNTLTETTSPSFTQYMVDSKTNHLGSNSEELYFFSTFDPVVKHAVTGTIPTGATVTVKVSGEEVAPTMTGNSFSINAVEKSLIVVTVGLEGYQNKVLVKNASEFTTDWNIGEITIADLTPVTLLGDLSITTDGDGGVEANVSVFDSTGKLVASEASSGVGGILLQELPEGDYTVVAIAKNAYISGITSLDSIESLGLKATEYAKKTAAVARGGVTEVTLTVPVISSGNIAEILDDTGSFVTIDRTTITPNMDFYGKVYYQMAEGNKASKIRINIPEGLTVTSVTSGSKGYGISDVYSDGVITIGGLSAGEQKSGIMYVGLKAPNTGKYCISASVESTSGVSAPVGSVDMSVESIKLEIKEDIVNSRIIPLKVWAEPGKQISIKLGKNDPIKFGKTNKLGFISGNVELPETTATGTYHVVIASDGTNTAKDSFYYEKGEIDLNDFYFIHANRKYNVVDNGVDKSGGFYYYVVDGREETRNWTLGASYISTSALSGDVYVSVQMMDGSRRNVAMSPIKTETLPDGRIKTHFAQNFYIETGGYHEFDDSLIPEGFDVDYVSDEDTSFATDEEYSEYLEAEVEAALEERKKDILEIMGDQWTIEDITVLYTDIIVGGYHISENEDCAAEFTALSPEDQQAIRDFEASFDGLLGAFSDAAGDVKPIYDYDSFNDYINENWFECGTYEGKTPSDFADEGFIVSDDGSFAYNEDGSSYIRLSEDGTSSERIDFIKDPKDTENLLSDDTMIWIKQSMTETDLIAGYLEDGLRNGKYGPKTSGLMDKSLRAWKIFGLAFNAYDAAKQSYEYVDGVEQTSKYNLQYTDIQNERKWAERMGRDKMSLECLNAIRAEENAAYELARAGDRRDVVCRNAAALGGLTVLAGGALLIAGAVVAPATLVALAAIETTVTIGSGAGELVAFNALNMRNVDVANARAAYDRSHLMRRYHCADEKTKAKYRLKGILDPSGFVYEAVESNKIEGATATIVYAEGGAEWDAAEYAQVNRQITDKDGTFAWDVPQGTYKVKIEMDGYDTAYSDALPVPPPQLDVRIPLVTKKAPEVESLNAYTDYIEVIFTQYMKIDDKSEIVATVNGKSVAASSFEWQDAEESPSGEKYAKVVRIPVPAGTKVGDTLDVQISKAKNYAGIPMSAAYSEKAKVTHRPTEIILNYETVLTMQAGSDKNITVRIKDENGDYMEGVSISALIENEYLAELAESTLVTDEEGKVVFKASALLPGLTNATFKVDGTTLKKNIKVQIETEAVRPKRPTASIAGIEFSEGAPKENYLTVAAGSTLTLACATEGATIYYTLDDTCPCQNSASRIKYTGPITITEDCRIRIAAYKDGLEYSERLNLNITVKQPDEFVISYDLNGGTLNGKTGIITEKHKEGEEITIPDAPTREGYKFDYWEGSKHYPGDKYVIVGDHTFKAVWIALDEDEQDDQEVEDKDSPSGDKSSDDEASNDSNGSGAKDATIDVPDNSKSAENDVAAKTGDPFDPVLWTVIMLTAFAGWLAVIILKKKRK